MEMGDQHYVPESRYLLNRKLGEPQGRSGRFGKESNSLAYIRIRTPDPPAASSSCFRATDSMGLRINRNYLFYLIRLIPVVFWIIRIAEHAVRRNNIRPSDSNQSRRDAILKRVM